MVVFATIFSHSVFAKDSVFSTWGKAIRGYDPVAYFTQSMPVKGDSNWTYKWNEAKWYFSSEQNLAKFKADPHAFVPQYGGYCAYGVSQGYLVSVDPNAWSIVDDKLYLNYSKSVQSDWLEDTSGYIRAANENWPKLVN